MDFGIPVVAGPESIHEAMSPVLLLRAIYLLPAALSLVGKNRKTSVTPDMYSFLSGKAPILYRSRRCTEVGTDARLWEKHFLLSLTSVKF